MELCCGVRGFPKAPLHQCQGTALLCVTMCSKRNSCKVLRHKVGAHVHEIHGYKAPYKTNDMSITHHNTHKTEAQTLRLLAALSPALFGTYA